MDEAHPSTNPRPLRPASHDRLSEMLRCRDCGEVIGVYEPLIRVTGGRAVESSRALDPELSRVEPSHGDVAHYHRACFERLGEVRRPAD